jgi:hypothetical protein
MSRPPVNPAPIDWSGENPGISLKEREDGPWTCLVSHFRVVVSPHGPGHAAVVMLDPVGSSGGPNVCYTDNEALARYLIDEFVVNFGAYRGNPMVPKLPLVNADRWWHEGDHRGGWTERIMGDGTDVTLRWTDLQTPFFVEYDTAHSATGRHEMFSLFVPGRSAEVVVNGQRPSGKPIPRDVAGRVSSTAFLAFSETWIRP